MFHNRFNNFPFARFIAVLNLLSVVRNFSHQSLINLTLKLEIFKRHVIIWT